MLRPSLCRRQILIRVAPASSKRGGVVVAPPPTHTGCFAPLVVLPLYSTPPQPHKYPIPDPTINNPTHPPPPNLTPQYPHDILPNTTLCNIPTHPTPPLFVTVKNNGSGLLNHLEQADEYGARCAEYQYTLHTVAVHLVFFTIILFVSDNLIICLLFWMFVITVTSSNSASV